MKYQQHTDNVRLTLRIPNELHVHVTQYARQHGVSFNRAMVEMLAAGQRQKPDVSAMARVLSDRFADALDIDREDNWVIYGQGYIDDAEAMLAAGQKAVAQSTQPD